MVISTKTECPECSKAAKSNILQADLTSSPTRIYCAEGHIFTKDQLSAVNSAKAPETLPEPPTNRAQMTLEAPPASQGPVTPPPEPVASPAPQGAALVPPVEVPAVEKPAPVSVVDGTRPLSTLERLSKSGYYQLAGGDLMVQLRIPEVFVGHLKEAAARYYPPTAAEPDTLQKHLQAVLNQALHLGWAD